ncbi:mannan chain length control protein LmeA [Micrococcus luteus]|uniref:mannan chain length control protein LmeA n=1 Tax=Micrococcus luteus TaxID=1270 RepID=UPI00343EF5B6
MRKLLFGLVAVVTAVVVAAVGADFGGAIYAEYRWARSVRASNDLDFDPWVGILGFPFATQAAEHRFHEVEIRAGGVQHPVVGKASLEATMHEVEAPWLISPDVMLPIKKLESRIIVDSTHVGRFMGIKDLLVEAPQVDTNDPTGGTTESGISGSTGIVLTGTPVASGFTEKVSVAVDLSIVGDDRTTLVVTPTGVLTGPGTADEEVPEDRTAAVLKAFAVTIPGLKLPFALTPTTAGARGSDLIIEGIASGVTVPIAGFRQS